MARLALVTEIGTKEVNQDACCALSANTARGEIALVVVCDGVGGLSMGEIASATIATRFSSWFENDLPGLFASEEGGAFFEAVKQSWRTLIAGLNDEIRSYGSNNGGRLGSTITAVLVAQGSYVFAHVGDCRAYRFNDSFLVQMTTDQTLVARDAARGIITPEEALSHPHRNVVLQAVGSQESIVPAFEVGPWSPNDALVVCSDGLYKTSTEDDFRTFFAQAQDLPEDQITGLCQQFVALARSRGEVDDISMVYLDSVAALAQMHPSVLPSDNSKGDCDLPTSGLSASDGMDG